MSVQIIAIIDVIDVIGPCGLAWELHKECRSAIVFKPIARNYCTIGILDKACLRYSKSQHTRAWLYRSVALSETEIYGSRQTEWD